MWRTLTSTIEYTTSLIVNHVLVPKNKGKLDRDKLEAFVSTFPKDTPEAFFKNTEPGRMPANWLQLNPQTGSYIKGSFSFFSDLPSGNDKNDLVKGVSYLHPSYKHGKHIILLNGWLTPSHFQSKQVARELLKYGVSTHMMELPYHMDRAPKGTFSGTGLIHPDISILFNGMRQGVSDARKLLRGLRSMGIADVGLMGFSLGGYTAGVVSSLEPRLDSLTMVAPLTDLGNTLLCSPLVKTIRNMMTTVSPERIRHLFEPFRLENYQPQLCNSRILLVNPLNDKVVFPHKVREVWEAWDKPQIIEPKHGHVSLFLSSSAFKGIVAELAHPLKKQSLYERYRPSFFLSSSSS